MPIFWTAGKIIFTTFSDSDMSVYKVAPVTPGPASLSEVQFASCGFATAVNTTGIRASSSIARAYLVAGVPIVRVTRQPANPGRGSVEIYVGLPVVVPVTDALIKADDMSFQ